MTIADPRFVAEAVLTTGKVLAFDDIGCLASWLRAEPRPVKALWVASFASGEWLAAEQATFLRTDSLRTPMASGLIASQSPAEADSLGAFLGGARQSWGEVAAAAASPHDGHGPS
jgi:copper chaperone NosL